MVEYFERMGGDWDTWAGGVHRRVAERAAAAAEVRPGECAIDLGCGTGGVLRHLATDRTQGGVSIGVDLSRPLLERARSVLPSARCAVMDAVALALPSESVDAVIIGQTLPLLDDPEAALAEARRVLRPQGRLIVTVQRRRLHSRAQRIFFAIVDDLAAEHPMQLPRASADRAVFGEPRVLTELLAAAGFERVRNEEILSGRRAATPSEWVELMTWAGPRPHALLSVLGPVKREELALSFAQRMRDAGDNEFHFHLGFTLATARKP